MRVLLVLATMALVCTTATEVENIQDGSPDELGEDVEDGQTPAPTFSVPTDSVTDQDADKTTRECYANSYEEANAHCNSKSVQEQCDGAFADWYCDYESEMNCDDRTSQEYQCTKYNTGQTAAEKQDTWHVAKCCVWNQAQADQLDGALGSGPNGEYTSLANGQMDAGEWELTQIEGSVAANGADLTPPCTFNIAAAQASADGAACPASVGPTWAGVASHPAEPLDLSCGKPGRPECATGRRRAPDRRAKMEEGN